MTEKTLIKAMREHFGYREGKTLADFSAELRELTTKDREDLAAEFLKIGVKIVEPPPQTVS